ncbi:MAG: LytR C-terminal domain-containing protein [Pseudonocardia sp.]
MTSPAPSGGSSPMRIGGFALVGLAVVAALVGLFTLTVGAEPSTDQALAPTSSTGEAAAPDPAAPAPAPADPAAPPAADPAAPTPAQPPVAAPAPAEEPIAPFSPEASEPDATLSSVRAPLRVYNNSRIKGLAEQAADDFRTAGWQVDSVGNYSSGVIPTSTVYYQDGEQDAAEALAAEFGMRVRPGFSGLQFGGGNLVVIVTREYGN